MASFDYVGVETFDSRGTGIKTFTTDFDTSGQPVVIAGQYSNVQINTAELTLLTAVDSGASTLPVTYFGYWLSALDAGNQVAFYRGGTEVFSFNPADVLSLTGNCPASPYCGRPEAPYEGGNVGEPYVFLNQIPEPSTLALAGLAVAGLMAKRRRAA